MEKSLYHRYAKSTRKLHGATGIFYGLWKGRSVSEATRRRSSEMEEKIFSSDCADAEDPSNHTEVGHPTVDSTGESDSVSVSEAVEKLAFHTR